ncbi:MAG: DUF4173 domain-containing protein [Methylobacteriaceae bacterium]|jgi:hypothetical protein|nr:DUF4173 domain-containing protein [Methylobacteriaceae bacterium]
MNYRASSDPRDSASFPLSPSPEGLITIGKLGLTAVIVSIGVVLLFPDDQPGGGFAFGVWLLVLATAGLAFRPIHAGSSRQWAALAAVLVLGVLPVLESLTWLSFVLSMTITMVFSLAVAGVGRRNPADIGKAAAPLLTPFAGLLYLIDEYAPHHSADISRSGAETWGGTLRKWAIPLVFLVVFIALFLSANPLFGVFFDKWVLPFFKTVDIMSFASEAAVVLAIFGGFFVGDLKRPLRTWRRVKNSLLPASPEGNTLPVLPEISTDVGIKSLFLFNILFAVQNIMDVAYLALHMDLPAGMTYAGYAHRGAYPLIVTALLAAVFVLGLMKPGSANEAHPTLRRLVYAWILQNMLLVASSMIRLDLYVEAYSLTQWRFAAFLWMILVGVGLQLIIIRISEGLGNRWLVLVNTSAALAMVYFACVFNSSAFIADYNVDSWLAGKGRLDLCYLSELSPHNIPAIDRVLREADDTRAQSVTNCRGYRLPLPELRRELENMRSIGLAKNGLSAAAPDIHRMDFRLWRLKRYIDARADTPSW